VRCVPSHAIIRIEITTTSTRSLRIPSHSFSLAYANEGLLCSGSRDRTIKLWDVRHPSGADGSSIGGVATRAVATLRGHAASVRAITYLAGVGQLASLSVDGGLISWDAAAARPAGSFVMPASATEVMALASEDGCGGAAYHPRALAVGAQSAVHLFDYGAGSKRPVASLPVDDRGAGVRSLAMRGHVLAVGQADGVVCFVDMRRAGGAFLRRRLVMGPGERRHRAVEGSPASSPPNLPADLANAQAVFALGWSPGGRLAAAGGPLLTGQGGLYAAVWE